MSCPYFPNAVSYKLLTQMVLGPMEPNALAFSSSTIKHMDHSFIPLFRDGISPGVNGWSSILLCRFDFYVKKILLKKK